MKLLDLVERVYVINLPNKTDRRERVEKRLLESGLASPHEISWFRAVAGSSCPAPIWFQAGDSAWGCLQSHLQIVQQASMEGVGSYCVLEDDVIFYRDAAEILEILASSLPDDWGQFYLGGQHLKDPIAITNNELFWRCTNINRTHAFLLHRRAYGKFQQHITHAPDYIANGSWHVDHQLGMAHERQDWATYAPKWWLAGQDEGISDISAKGNPRMWWHYYGFGKHLPFIFLPNDPDPSVYAKVDKGVHFGNYLKVSSREDIGLDDCIGDSEKLQTWMGMIAGEAISMGRIPGIQHARISIEEVTGLWPGKVIHASECDIESLLKYPSNGLIAELTSDFWRLDSFI